jgi:hypothetical protein
VRSTLTRDQHIIECAAHGHFVCLTAHKLQSPEDLSNALKGLCSSVSPVGAAHTRMFATVLKMLATYSDSHPHCTDFREHARLMGMNFRAIAESYTPSGTNAIMHRTFPHSYPTKVRMYNLLIDAINNDPRSMELGAINSFLYGAGRGANLGLARDLLTHDPLDNPAFLRGVLHDGHLDLLDRALDIAHDGLMRDVMYHVGVAPLSYEDKMKTIEKLIELGPFNFSADKDMTDLLHGALRVADVKDAASMQIVEFALARGASLVTGITGAFNPRSDDAAVYMPVVKLMIERLLENYSILTPLSNIASAIGKSGHIDLVEYILGVVGDHGGFNMSLFMYMVISGACERGNLEIIKYMVEKFPDCMDDYLDSAKETCNSEIYEYLAENMKKMGIAKRQSISFDDIPLDNPLLLALKSLEMSFDNLNA